MAGSFWSWFAGFWEGEGSFLLYTTLPSMREGRRYYVQFKCVQSGMRGKQVIEFIQNKLGVGNIHHALPKGGRQERYEWIVYHTKEIINLAEKLLPFLKFRKDEVAEKLALLKKLYNEQPFHIWSKKEDAFLEQNWREKSDIQMAKELNRSLQSVEQHRRYLGLYRRGYPKRLQRPSYWR